MANGPREPGVGAELIGTDVYQKYEKEFSDADSRKLSPVKYNKTDKLDDVKVSKTRALFIIKYTEKGKIYLYYNCFLQKSCSSKEDAEHLDKRSVDGSESKFTQWELELQASMEKLNRLSYAKQREIARSSPDAVKVDTANETCHDPLASSEQLDAHDSNRLSTTKDPGAALEKARFVGGRTPYLRRSCSTISTMTILGDAITSSITSKCVASRSLSNSPVNRTACNLENKVPERVGGATASKHVPNRSSRLDVKDRKTQSSWDINASGNVDAEKVASENQERNDCNTNDTLASKSHVQSLSTARAANTEFLPAKRDSSEHHRATQLPSEHPVSSRDDRKVSRRSASRSANSSPMKLKKLLTPSTRSPSSASVENVNGESIGKRYPNKTASIRELPLLSFFGRASAIRGKSCSMIDLDSKQNLKTLLDNSLLGNIQAVSAERLADARHKLVSDRSGATTTMDDVRK